MSAIAQLAVWDFFREEQLRGSLAGHATDSSDGTEQRRMTARNLSRRRHRIKRMTETARITPYTPQTINQAKLLGDFLPRSEKWHQARETGIGGSEIGTILGLNPWESAYTLWCKRTNRIPSPEIDNWSVRFGRAFELPILEIWAEDNPGWEVHTTGTYARGIQHANPDAIAKNRKTGEWIVLEVKTARNEWGEVPAHYQAQLQWYMDVLGFQRGAIIGVTGWNWREDWYQADDFQQQVAREAAERFWQRLKEDKRPEWDGSDSTYETVRIQHPLISDEEVEIDGAHQLALAAAEFEAAKEKLNRAKSEVADLMGDAKHAYVTIDGKKQRVASRQARGDGLPFLVVKK